jgi:hypothetical protein
MDSAVILWWDAEIRLRAPNGTVLTRTVGEREDQIEAILELVDRSERITASRIIYHPASLDVHAVACPPVSRARLRAVLAAEYPALNLPHAVWSAEPPRRSLDGSGHTTVLYLDNRSRLRRLVEGLGKRGITVDGVWPLLSLVENTPPCNEGEFLAVIAIGGRSLVACASPTGSRYFRLQTANEFEEKAASDVNAALSLFDGAALPPGLLLIEQETSAARLRETVKELALTEITITEFLATANRLKRGSFSDFLPQTPFFARPAVLARIAAVAGFLLMLGSAWHVYDSGEANELAHRQMTAYRAEHAELERLVETHRAAKARIDGLARELSLVEFGPPLQGRLLLALARATPPTISLESVSITGSDFVIKGRILEGAASIPPPLTVFIQTLAASNPPWSLMDPGSPGLLRGMVSALSPTPVPAPAAFTLRGFFLPSDIPSRPHA